jgi:aldehyde:ferredoxin oxidoreductase
MVYCQFLAGALNAEYTARLMTAVTGVEYSSADLICAGERAWYLRRLFNLRLGVGSEADTLPKRIIEQIAASAASLKDVELMLTEFYRQRELDEDGMPSSKKLAQLGLDTVISDL